MSSPFHVCQDTCLCAPSTEGYGKGKVLYCYGEVDTNSDEFCDAQKLH